MTLEGFFETVLAVLVGGGLLTAVVQVVSHLYFRKKEKEEAVNYLAVRLAFLFEGYGVYRAAAISDYDVAVEEGREADARSYLGGGVPVISSLPFEETHKLLDCNLLNDILEFGLSLILDASDKAISNSSP